MRDVIARLETGLVALDRGEGLRNRPLGGDEQALRNMRCHLQFEIGEMVDLVVDRFAQRSEPGVIGIGVQFLDHGSQRFFPPFGSKCGLDNLHPLVVLDRLPGVANGDRAAFLLVAVEQLFARLAPDDRRELPEEVLDILDTRIEAEASRGRKAVTGIPDQQGAPFAVSLGDLGGHDPVVD